VIFIDALHVKIRDGHVTNRPIYVVLAVTVDGDRDILGLWASDGGEGAKFRLHRERVQPVPEPSSGRCPVVAHGMLRFGTEEFRSLF
jgi:hypothetical protein